MTLQFTAHEKVEFLIVPTQLHIRLQMNGIVSLENRVEDFMKVNRTVLFQTLCKVITYYNLLNRSRSHEPDHIHRTEFV